VAEHRNSGQRSLNFDKTTKNETINQLVYFLWKNII